MQRGASQSTAPVASPRGGDTASGASGPGWQTLPGLEDEADIDPAELREFLSADLLDVQADPVFKERLRRKLWRLVRTRYGSGSSSED